MQAHLVPGEGSLSSLQAVTLSLCPHIEEKEIETEIETEIERQRQRQRLSFSGLFYKVTNPIHEYSTLLTPSPPKYPIFK